MTICKRDEWFVNRGNFRLKLVKLLQILLNSSVIVFFLHMSDSPEISSIGEMFRLSTSKVDCCCNMVIVHGINTPSNVFNHVGRQRVVAMFSVHLYDT